MRLDHDAAHAPTGDDDVLRERGIEGACKALAGTCRIEAPEALQALTHRLDPELDQGVQVRRRGGVVRDHAHGSSKAAQGFVQRAWSLASKVVSIFRNWAMCAALSSPVKPSIEKSPKLPLTSWLLHGTSRALSNRREHSVVLP